jgi:hypothetical protein
MADTIPIPGYYWHNAKAIIGAFKKGWIAASENKPCKSPYTDVRGSYHNNVTFSRAFISAWEDGWKHWHAAQQAAVADRDPGAAGDTSSTGDNSQSRGG